MTQLLLGVLLWQTPDLASADRLYESGRFDDAITQYRALLMTRPSDPLLLLRTGACEYQRGQFAEAEKHFRKALMLAPDLPPAMVGLGTTLITLGRAGEAIPLLESAAKSTPNDRMARRALGHAYQEEEKFVEGEGVLTKLVTEDPRDSEAWYYLGLLFFNRNYAQPALEAFDKLLAIEPNHVRARLYRAGTLSLLGRIAEAKSHFALLEGTPELARDAEFFLGYTQALFHAGDYEAALKKASAGADASPDSAKLRYWKARLLLETGKPEAAETEARRATQLAPNLANPHHLLLRIYQRLGHDAQAAEQAAWLRAHSDTKARGTGR
jgi:predicted Zn-dependent protease